MTPVVSPEQAAAATPQRPQLATALPPFPGFDYKLPTAIKSATDIWNAWHGLGVFAGLQPMKGGIQELVRSSGTKWRSNYLPHENKAFSRWNQIIMMMKEEKGERTDILVFLKEMDDIYNGMRNQKVSPFEKELKRRKKLRLAE